MATRVTDEGQVTIPKPVLEHLGIGPGSEVAFRRAADGTIVLEKAVAEAALPPSRFEELVGIAVPGLSTDEIMAMTRGD
jgi:antitoxin PrlF